MGEEKAKRSGPLSILTTTAAQARELLAGIADVAGMEGRLAAYSLARMLSLAVLAALLACGAWGLLLAAFAVALAAAGIPWLWLLPLMAALNAALAWWAWGRIRVFRDDLAFSGTRQLLKTLPATLVETESPASTTSAPPPPTEPAAAPHPTASRGAP